MANEDNTTDTPREGEQGRGPGQVDPNTGGHTEASLLEEEKGPGRSAAFGQNTGDAGRNVVDGP